MKSRENTETTFALKTEAIMRRRIMAASKNI